MSVIATFGRMIKFSHSIFALPFALASGVIAARSHPVSARQWLLIVVCMVLARTAAMGFNRVVDAPIDAKNPRTAIREIPSGLISTTAAWTMIVASSVGFIAASAALHPLCGKLSPIALLVVFGYSYGKRFTAFVHVWLGIALGLAPVAVWIAVTGTVAAPALMLAAAVATWVAGFDILYSLQDEEFDRAQGLFSVPVAFGRVGALWVSALLHVGTISILASLPGVVGLRWPYWAGWLAISGILLWEHWIVRPNDLSRIDKAFFDLNGYISLLFLGAVLLA